jgi:xanthine dehydrogenase accessory factor
MKELHDIINAYDKAVLLNKQTALATVVKVEGSSYRRPGARMLVTEDGELTGAISGGCLEGDALRKAMLAISEQKNKLVTYDTTDEEDAKLGIQLGCNGIVYILFEPIKQGVENQIELIKKIFEERENAVIATAFNTDKHAQQFGTCYFSNNHQTINCNAVLKQNIENDGLIVLQNEKSHIHKYNDNEVLFQFVPTPVRLVIVGAGNDAIPLMQAADIIGWEIIVADGRVTHATSQRFPRAKVIVSKSDKLLNNFQSDTQTAFVLMTHNYNYDVQVLKHLINLPSKYIGLLGPKEKRNRMLEELIEDGINIHETVLDKIYAPVGLDIGAETAEEIAVSIVSEIKAVLSIKKGGMLRDKQSQIHERIMENELDSKQTQLENSLFHQAL